MNYKFFYIIIIFLLTSCVNVVIENDNTNQIKTKNFTSKGFTLTYRDELLLTKKISGKIDNRSLLIFQKNLKKGTNVKITNLINSKYVIAKVAKNHDYPNFFNSVISMRVSKILEIDENQPYVEIKEINNGTSFVAKKAKTFDEEKNVASKAPVDDIQIKDLSKKKKSIDLLKNDKKSFIYIIKVADFYFVDSAKKMKVRILKETKIANVDIIELSKNKSRVFLGPFDNLKCLKKSFDAINILELENLEIIKK